MKGVRNLSDTFGRPQKPSPDNYLFIMTYTFSIDTTTVHMIFIQYHLLTFFTHMVKIKLICGYQYTPLNYPFLYHVNHNTN